MAKAKSTGGGSDEVTLVANYQVTLDADGTLAAEGETFIVDAKAAAELIACGAAKALGGSKAAAQADAV